MQFETMKDESPVPEAHNGTSRHAPFDRWFRYPAGFSREALGLLFDPAKNLSRGTVLDPFTGAGTVGTWARRSGLNFFGVEAHPEIAELAALKTMPLDSDDLDLKKSAMLVVDLANKLVVDTRGESELVTRCFHPEMLSELVAIRTVLQTPRYSTTPHLKWALLGTLRDVANVKVGWPYLRPSIPRVPPFKSASERFVARANWIAEDLETLDRSPRSLIVRGDSSDAKTWENALATSENLMPASVCLTSPPYLNNFDYADATRLETYFWGRNSSWSEMVSDVRSKMLVATTQQTSIERAKVATNSLEELPGLVALVEPLVSKLKDQREERGSGGKAYDRVLPAYVQGMYQVLSGLKTALEPGSWCGWVIGDSAPYGIYIDTPELIGNVSELAGFDRGSSTVIRERGHRWQPNMRHSVPLNERLIWFKTPSS